MFSCSLFSFVRAHQSARTSPALQLLLALIALRGSYSSIRLSLYSFIAERRAETEHSIPHRICSCALSLSVGLSSCCAVLTVCNEAEHILQT